MIINCVKLENLEEECKGSVEGESCWSVVIKEGWVGLELVMEAGLKSGYEIFLWPNFPHKKHIWLNPSQRIIWIWWPMKIEVSKGLSILT